MNEIDAVADGNSAASEIELVVNKNYHLLNDIEKGYYVNHAINFLSNMTLEEIRKFANTYPSLFQNSDASLLLILCWAIERSLLIGHDNGLTEFKELRDTYETNLSVIFKSYESIQTQSAYMLFTNLYERLVDYLEVDSDRSVMALEILNNPLVTNYNNYVHYLASMIKVPGSIPVKTFNKYSQFDSIADALRAYGFDNEALVRRYDILQRQYPLETQIYLVICPVPLETKLDKLNSSFSASQHAKEWMITETTVDQLLNLPLTDINYNSSMYYVARCRIYYINAVTLWRRLGLGRAYQHHYGNDDTEFWQSPLSFMDIYHQLHTINSIL